MSDALKSIESYFTDVNSENELINALVNLEDEESITFDVFQFVLDLVC